MTPFTVHDISSLTSQRARGSSWDVMCRIVKRQEATFEKSRKIVKFAACDQCCSQRHRRFVSLVTRATLATSPFRVHLYPKHSFEVFPMTNVIRLLGVRRAADSTGPAKVKLHRLIACRFQVIFTDLGQVLQQQWCPKRYFHNSARKFASPPDLPLPMTIAALLISLTVVAALLNWSLTGRRRTSSTAAGSN
jgi:hypothetical protein